MWTSNRFGFSKELWMSRVAITHIGGPTVLIEVDGWRILTDPTFDPPGEHWHFGWGATSRKLTGPAIALADLGPIDLVLLSHDHHGDNLDHAGREMLSQVSKVVTTVPGKRRLSHRDVVGLAPWDKVESTKAGAPNLEIVATPARHGPPGSGPIVGAVIGFALRWEGQENGVLWISGDTVLFDGVREVGQRFNVGTAVFHLGGVRFPISGPFRYTMTAQDAVELGQQLKPQTIVPVHYEGWKHFRQDRSAAREVLDHSELGNSVLWLEPGMPTELTV